MLVLSRNFTAKRVRTSEWKATSHDVDLALTCCFLDYPPGKPASTGATQRRRLQQKEAGEQGPCYAGDSLPSCWIDAARKAKKGKEEDIEGEDCSELFSKTCMTPSRPWYASAP